MNTIFSAAAIAGHRRIAAVPYSGENMARALSLSEKMALSNLWGSGVRFAERADVVL